MYCMCLNRTHFRGDTGTVSWLPTFVCHVKCVAPACLRLTVVRIRLNNDDAHSRGPAALSLDLVASSCHRKWRASRGLGSGFCLCVLLVSLGCISSFLPLPCMLHTRFLEGCCLVDERGYTRARKTAVIISRWVGWLVGWAVKQVAAVITLLLGELGAVAAVARWVGGAFFCNFLLGVGGGDEVARGCCCSFNLGWWVVGAGKSGSPALG